MAALKVISFTELLASKPHTLATLQDAATHQGFFYLNLENELTAGILLDIDKCFETAQQLYKLDLQEKLKYDIDKLGPHKLNGYKPLGRNAGVEKGKRDGFEAYLVSRDGICNNLREEVHVALPSVLQSQQSLFQGVMDTLHEVGEVVLRSLSRVLELPNNKHLQKSHRLDRLSTSAFGILKYPELVAECPQLGQSAHTDVGSLTFLFCSQPGLQVLNPNTSLWEFVEPKPGHAIVNIGDSLRFLSGSRLKSCLHRVVPYCEGRVAERYSCAYFMRPEMDALFEDDDGQKWSSIDWHDRKYAMFRAPISKQKESSVLTGRAGFVGLWKDES